MFLYPWRDRLKISWFSLGCKSKAPLRYHEGFRDLRDHFAREPKSCAALSQYCNKKAGIHYYKAKFEKRKTQKRFLLQSFNVCYPIKGMKYMTEWSCGRLRNAMYMLHQASFPSKLPCMGIGIHFVLRHLLVLFLSMDIFCIFCKNQSVSRLFSSPSRIIKSCLLP